MDLAKLLKRRQELDTFSQFFYYAIKESRRGRSYLVISKPDDEMQSWILLEGFKITNLGNDKVLISWGEE